MFSNTHQTLTYIGALRLNSNYKVQFIRTRERELNLDPNMATRRISRGAMDTMEECPFSAVPEKDEKAMHLVEHEDILSTSNHGAVHEDGQSGNLFSAILSRWLMSNAFYSSTVNSLRFQ